MSKSTQFDGVPAIGLLYFAGMAFSCLLGRPGDGVAMVWLSSALLAGWLYGTDPRRWTAALVVCAIANEIGGGLFGLGWIANIGLTAVNLGEAVAAAWLARHAVRAYWPAATFELVSVAMLGGLLVIPAASALLAATTLNLVSGMAFVATFRIWMLGHAVGLIAVLPFSLVVASGVLPDGRVEMQRRRSGDTPVAPRNRLVSVLMVATMLLLSACVFAQPAGWPLAAPLLFSLFVAVWGDVRIATVMPMLVALIAAPVTFAGYGPIAPGMALAADRLQMGLLYAGLVACCSLPVVVEQARRRQEVARLSRSAAHFEAMSQRADTLIGELRRVALTDQLTGLPNRHAFFTELAQQAAAQETACVAMIDIDHFKLVNDRFGHAAGDTVLRNFAEIARSTFRSGDTVGRIGGEEFAVILRGVTVDQACVVCQRLVDRVAGTDIAIPEGSVRVTISSGIAAIGHDSDAAMAAADGALYAAKRGGRSRLSSVADSAGEATFEPGEATSPERTVRPAIATSRTSA